MWQQVSIQWVAIWNVPSSKHWFFLLCKQFTHLERCRRTEIWQQVSVQWVAVWNVCHRLNIDVYICASRRWCGGWSAATSTRRRNSCARMESMRTTCWRSSRTSLASGLSPFPRDKTRTVCLKINSCSCLLWFALVYSYLNYDRLVVKASTSRAEDPGFESRMRRFFSGVESCQWLQNWHSSGYPARRLAL